MKRNDQPQMRAMTASRFTPPVSIGRSARALHSDHEPGNSRPGGSPATSRASSVWQAVTPEPQ